MKREIVMSDPGAQPLCLACGRVLLPPYQGKAWCRTCLKWIPEVELK